MIELKKYWTSHNGNRPRTNYIVIHHAAAVYPLGKAVQSIYDYHCKKWPLYNAAGYHIICQEELDGTVVCYLVNPPNMQGAGVAGRNDETFHICLATDLTKVTPEYKWINASKEAYEYARNLYPNAQLVGHKDIALPSAPTSCPGATWNVWKHQLTGSNKGIKIQSGITQNIDVLRDKLFRRGVNPDYIVPIVSAYTSYGELTGIGNVYSLAQGIHETGWFTSERFVKSFNPAGLGATNDGACGSEFNTISEGIFAQFAHLLVYATKPEQNSYFLESMANLSPRYKQAVQKFGRGSAIYWLDLSGKWATGPNYGNKIIEIGNYLL